MFSIFTIRVILLLEISDLEIFSLRQLFPKHRPYKKICQLQFSLRLDHVELDSTMILEL